MTILEKIENRLFDLTKSENIIANYILRKPEDVELYTITKIAEFTGTSKSAVLRFCQKLGYEGYSEFRYDMINYLLNKGSESEEKKSHIGKTLMLFNKAVADLEHVDQDEVYNLIDAITKANQVYSTGVYKTNLIAQKFAYNFIDRGKEVFLLKDMVEVSHLPYHLKENSLFVVFSISGNSAQLKDFFKSNQKVGRNTILITSNPKATLSKLVNKTLLINTDGFTEQLVDPHAIYFIFIELLTQMYSEKK